MFQPEVPEGLKATAPGQAQVPECEGSHVVPGKAMYPGTVLLQQAGGFRTASPRPRPLQL